MPENLSYFDNAKEWAEKMTARYARQKVKSGLLTLDIDETILDSEGRWYELYVSLAKQQDSQEVAPFEVFTLSPRIHFSPLVEDYVAFKAHFMLDQRFNAGLSLLQTSHSLLELAESYDIPHGYLSTRAASLGEVTCQNLEEHNFPLAPTLLRDEHIPYGDTIGFKIGALAVLRTTLDNYGFENTLVYYVDDYAQLIAELNESSTRIRGIHFTPTTSWGWIVRECLGVPGTASQ